MGITVERFRAMSPAERAPIWRAILKDANAANRLVWIYAIQQGDAGPVKIGQTRCPWERLKTLQQGNPIELHGLAAWRTLPEIEKLLHEEYAQYRIRGEWFEPAPELIEDVTREGGCFCDWAPLTKDERVMYVAQGFDV